MATKHTLTITNLPNIAGAPYVKNMRAYVVTNLPAGEALIDTTTNDIMLGGQPIKLFNGSGSVSLPATDAIDLNVVANTVQYEVRAEYADPATRDRKTWRSGYFALTADANLADVAADSSPMAVESASAYAAEAKAARDGAVAIAGPTDATVAGLVKNTGGIGPLTEAALSTTFAAPRQSATIGSRLARWQSALANASAAPADLVVIGDSISEGAWAGYGTRWIDRLRDTLRARYQPAGVTGGAGFYPIRNIGGWAASPWVVSGSGGIDVNQGLGVRGVAVTDNTTTYTLTFTGTGVDVFYTSTTGSGSLEIKIDGAVVATIATAGAQDSGHVWSSGALTAGSHTVGLRASTPWAWPEGAMVYNGDRTSGIRVWDASHFGWTLADFNNNVAGWGTALTNTGADLVLIAAGRNDWSGGTSLATYQTRLQLLHDYVELKAPNADVAFVIEHETLPGGTPAAPWSDFADLTYTVAEANDRAVIDMTRFGSSSAAKAAPLSLLHSDEVHPLAKGHAWYAQAVATAIAP